MEDEQFTDSIFQIFYGFPGSKNLCQEYVTVFILFDGVPDIQAFAEDSRNSFTFRLWPIAINGDTPERQGVPSQNVLDRYENVQ